MATRVSAALLELPSKPHALYRFYDRTDVLLYVGITVDIRARFANHRDEKPWWTAAIRIEMEHFATREEALAAEAEAIRTEKPLYNVTHNELARLPDGVSLAERRDQALEPEMVTAEWLLANWPRIPAPVRDIIEVPAHRAGARELAAHLAENFLEENIEGHRAAAGEAEVDEEEPSPEDVVVGAVALAVEEVTSNYTRLAREMKSVFAQVPIERVRSARATAIVELRSQMGTFTDADELWNTSRHLRRETDRGFLTVLPHAERQNWIRAVTNRKPYLIGDDVLGPAAELARMFKNTGVIPEGHCFGGGQAGTTCPELARVDLVLAGCDRCDPKDPPCAGHRICCEMHLAVSRMGNDEFTDVHGQAYKILDWRVVEIDFDDPWNTF